MIHYLRFRHCCLCIGTLYVACHRLPAPIVAALPCRILPDDDHTLTRMYITRILPVSLETKKKRRVIGSFDFLPRLKKADHPGLCFASSCWNTNTCTRWALLLIHPLSDGSCVTPVVRKNRGGITDPDNGRYDGHFCARIMARLPTSVCWIKQQHGVAIDEE